MDINNNAVIRFTNRLRLGFFRNIYKVGTVTVDEKSQEIENTRIRESKHYSNNYKIKKTDNAITEYDFYVMYLTLMSTANSLSKDKSKKVLTPTHIMYLAKIMEKPLEYTIPTNSKSNKLTELATEVGKTGQSFYNAINKLKKNNWIYVNEDSNLKLATSLENLRTMIKTQLDVNNGVAIWDSLFRYVITND